MRTLMYVEAKTQLAGLHHWPTAPEDRDYLAHPHRHVFVVNAQVEVNHDDRDVEYHDLVAILGTGFRQLGQAGKYVGLVDFGGQSCEHLARSLLEYLLGLGLAVRAVSVFEDGENGSVVYAS